MVGLISIIIITVISFAMMMEGWKGHELCVSIIW